MKKVLFLLVLIPFLFGCEKEETKPTYSLTVFNNSLKSPYSFKLMEFNGDLVREVTLSAGSSAVFSSLEQKKYKWNALQLSGYLLYPTEKSGTITVDSNKVISFPH